MKFRDRFDRARFVIEEQSANGDITPAQYRAAKREIARAERKQHQQGATR